MHRIKYKWLRRLLRVAAVLVLLFALLCVYVVRVSNIPAPAVKDTAALQYRVQAMDTGLATVGNSWFRKSSSGLYEMYSEGEPFARGVTEGKLSATLVQRQEDYFVNQLFKMIPSGYYRHFLKYFVGWFNRDLPKYILPEYQQEIYGISFSASDNYSFIGNKYQRILNYHSAHDIGHALQNMMLVGCTSFGTWGPRSADGSLIIGRNFDFYVGDDFAKNKIISFNNPSSGYKFMSVTWGGFIGVVSGMNEKGLTVTINADKSGIPGGAATPVSLVAREIVQYAKNISEAVAIARKRKMFVSESFLIGSAIDNKAVVIEKTPDSIAVYDPGQNEILCTNHFQSNTLLHSQSNEAQMAENATTYRYNRLNELLQNNGANTVQKTIGILRDYNGMQNTDIGLGNEKAVNQFIAHHAVVFEPQQLRVWVSTAPWQLGAFMCYDLKKIFALGAMKQNREIADLQYTVPADSFIYTKRFAAFEKFRVDKQLLHDGKLADPEQLIAENPNYYAAYMAVADFYYTHKNYAKALPLYQKAATMEIASAGEKKHVQERIQSIQRH